MFGVAFGALLGLLMAVPAFAAEKEKTRAEELLERRQKVQIMGYFLKDPKDAEIPETGIAVQSFNQAVEFFQKEEYDLAREAVEESLALDDANAFAYELLGDIDSVQDKLADAKKNYEISYNLDPKPEVKEKIEKLGAEQKVQKKLSTYKEEHFVIRYQREQDKDRGFELRELLRATYANISKEFGHYFSRQVVVMLYDADDFREISGLPHWAAGLYDGKIRMPFNNSGFNDAELKALTAHEMTHAFVAAISASRAPAWINEGLAEYMESKQRPVDMIVFNSAIKTGNLMPLVELLAQDATSKLQDPLVVTLFYEQSYHLVNYLVNRYGMFMVKQMLVEFGKGKTSEEVIGDKLRISSARLEKEWKATFIK